MAISGSLQDVSITDVVQFVHLGRRSGTLMVSRGEESAALGFHSGKLVSARTPGSRKLGDVLLATGQLDPVSLRLAVQLQATEQRQRSLGQILLALDAISPDTLRAAIETQIAEAMAEVSGWEWGTFDFQLDDLQPIDDISVTPPEPAPEEKVDPLQVLLEGARIFDERARHGGAEALSAESTLAAAAGAAASPAAKGPTGGQLAPTGLATVQQWREALDLSPVEQAPALSPELSGALPHRLVLVTHDQALADDLAQRLEGRMATYLAPLETAAVTMPGDTPPVVLVDLRPGGVGLEALAELCGAHAEAMVIAVADLSVPLAAVYELGVAAVVPAEPAAIVGCVNSLQRNLRATSTGDGRRDEGSLARLRRVYTELRSGLLSATVALNLMQLISESFERGILFLVRRDQLATLGAFGVSDRGRPLAEAMRGLRLDLTPDCVLTNAVAKGEVQTVAFAEAGLPEAFLRRVGVPRNERVVVFPVLGAERVIAVVYTDNGEHDEPVEDWEILELAASQVGIAFENELLRQQVSRKGA